MLEAIRAKSASILVKLLLGLLILSFAVWGVGDVVRGVSSTTVMAEVGDVEISPDALNSEVQQELDRLRRALGGQFDENLIQRSGLAGIVLQRMIDRTLIRLGADSLGVAIDDSLVSDEIRRTKTFFNPMGYFDRSIFQQVIRSNGFSEGQYVDMMRADMARVQYVGSLSTGGPTPAALAKALFKHRQQSRVAEMVAVDDKAMTGLAPPEDGVLAEYHQEEAARYTAPEYRTVTYLRLDSADLMLEMAVSEEDVRESFDARAGEFRKPERRRVEQILLASEEDAKAAHGKLAVGGDFVAVAKEVAGMEADAIKLGTVEAKDLPPDLAEATFAVTIGAHSEPIKSALGWHIMRVTLIEPSQERTFEEVRAELETGLRKEKAIDALYELSNRVEDTLGGGATLEEAAQSLNLKVATVAALDAAGKDDLGKAVDGLPGGSVFLKTAFEVADGEDSVLTEAGSNGYFILRVDKVMPPALRPLSTIRGQVVADWKVKRREEAAKTAAGALAAEVEGGADLAQAATRAGFQVTTTEAFLRTGEGAKDILATDVVAGLFDTRVGGVVSGRGKAGWQVARLKEIRDADPTSDKDGVETIQREVSAAMRGDLLSQLASGLRARHPVSIRNRAIQRLYSEQ